MDAARVGLLFWIAVFAGRARTTGGWAGWDRDQLGPCGGGQYRECSGPTKAFIQAGRTHLHERTRGFPEELIGCCVLQQEIMYSPWSKPVKHKKKYDALQPITDVRKQNRRNLYYLLTSQELTKGISDAATLICDELRRVTGHRSSVCTTAPELPPCQGITKDQLDLYISVLETSITSLASDQIQPCFRVHSSSLQLRSLLSVLDILGIQTLGSVLETRLPEDVFNRFFEYAFFARRKTTSSETTMTAETAEGKETHGKEPRRSETSRPAKKPSASARVRLLRGKKTGKETSFLALSELQKVLLRRRPSRPPPPRTLLLRPDESDTVLRGSGRPTFFSGPQNPVVSLLHNLLLQAWWRQDELFGPDTNSNRLFPNFIQILLGQGQQRQALLSAFCGTAPISFLDKLRLPKTMRIVPLVYWNMATRVVGLAKLSCDSMRLTLRVLELGENTAQKTLNDLMLSLPSNRRNRAVPLERNVPPGTNLRRFCFAFSKQANATPSALHKCRWEDTIFEGILSKSDLRFEALTEQQLRQAVAFTMMSDGIRRGDETSNSVRLAPSQDERAFSLEPLRLSAVNGYTVDELEETSTSNADLKNLLEVDVRTGRSIRDTTVEAGRRHMALIVMYFYWLLLRGGDGLSASSIANVLAMDLSTWWLSLLFVDRRSMSTIQHTVRKAARQCTRALPGSGPTRYFEELCNNSPSGQYWKKQCSAKQLGCACRYYEEVCSSLPLTSISAALTSVAEHDEGAKRPRAKNGRPYVVLGNSLDALRVVEGANAYATIFLMLFQYCGSTSMEKRKLLRGEDQVAAMYTAVAKHEMKSKKRKWYKMVVPRSIRRLGKALQRRGYSPRLAAVLKKHLSPRIVEILLKAVTVVVHPAAFLVLNQWSPSFSNATGQQQNEGGYAGQMDQVVSSWGKEGLSDGFLSKMRSGGEVTRADLGNVSILKTPVPSSASYRSTTKARLVDALQTAAGLPGNRARARAGCYAIQQTTAHLLLLHDSLEYLKTTPATSLHIIGTAVNPPTASSWRPGRLHRALGKTSRFLKRLLRLPPWVTNHLVYVGFTVDVAGVRRVLEELTALYHTFKTVFKNHVLFMKAVGEYILDLQPNFQDPLRAPQSLPPTNLLPRVNSGYPAMPPEDRRREFQNSALEFLFVDIWMLIISLSMNNFLNRTQMQRLEAQFGKSGWTQRMGSPLVVNSLRMILLGNDLPLMLYDQLLTKEQKTSLKRTRYGASSTFAQQATLTGTLYGSQGCPSLGAFLLGQGPFMGTMITLWQKKRKEDRIREILSWALLVLSLTGAILGSVVQTSQVVEQTVQNQSSLAGVTTECPPIGICADGTVGDPSASPPATAITSVLKTVLLVGLAGVVGPLVSAWGIAASYFKVLSRMEMALVSVCRRLGVWFRKKWTGRWFATKRNTFILAEKEKVDAKVQKGRADLVAKDMPDLVQQHEETKF